MAVSRKFYRVTEYEPEDARIQESLKRNGPLFIVEEVRAMAKCNSENDAKAIAEAMMKNRGD